MRIKSIGGLDPGTINLIKDFLVMKRIAPERLGDIQQNVYDGSYIVLLQPVALMPEIWRTQSRKLATLLQDPLRVEVAKAVAPELFEIAKDLHACGAEAFGQKSMHIDANELFKFGQQRERKDERFYGRSNSALAIAERERDLYPLVNLPAIYSQRIHDPSGLFPERHVLPRSADSEDDRAGTDEPGDADPLGK